MPDYSYDIRTSEKSSSLWYWLAGVTGIGLVSYLVFRRKHEAINSNATVVQTKPIETSQTQQLTRFVAPELTEDQINQIASTITDETMKRTFIIGENFVRSYNRAGDVESLLNTYGSFDIKIRIQIPWYHLTKGADTLNRLVNEGSVIQYLNQKIPRYITKSIVVHDGGDGYSVLMATMERA